MVKNIDISRIVDVNVLKSLAYDELAKINQGQRNLTAIEKRIEEVYAILSTSVGATKQPVPASDIPTEPAPAEKTA